MPSPLLCVCVCLCKCCYYSSNQPISADCISAKKQPFSFSYLYSPTYFTTSTKASDIKSCRKEMLTKQLHHTTSLLSNTLRRLMDDCLVLPQIISSPLSSKAGTATKQSRKYTGGGGGPLFPACVHNHNITNTAFRRSG